MATTNTTNTVKLSKAGNWVRFEITQGDQWASLCNSAGEALFIPLSEARQRMETLQRSGWAVR